MKKVLKEMQLKTMMKPECVEINDRGVTMKVTLHPCNVETRAGGATFSVHLPADRLEDEIEALMEAAAAIAGDHIEQVHG